MGSNVKRRETRMEGSEKENDTWWEKAKYSKTINAYAVFVQKKAEEYKNKDQPFGFKDCSKLWKKTPDKETKKFAKYAEEFIRSVYEGKRNSKRKDIFAVCA